MPSSLDNKKQVQYFENLYCTDSANICLTSGTTNEISILETLTQKQVMLKLALKGHFFSGNMLNIPSGNDERSLQLEQRSGCFQPDPHALQEFH